MTEIHADRISDWQRIAADCMSDVPINLEPPEGSEEGFLLTVGDWSRRLSVGDLAVLWLTIDYQYEIAAEVDSASGGDRP